MTVKKWRPLWSYDIEKTECWLSEMAADGNRLIHVNRQSRMFVFEQAERNMVDYRIVYDKRQRELPKVLVEVGWADELVIGNWRFMKNGQDAIRIYPSREGILKRNRLHGYVIAALAILNAISLTTMTTAFLSLLFGFPGEIVRSPLWILTGLFAAQGIAAIALAFYLHVKLKSFEREHFETELDDIETGVKKTFVKRKFAWMYAPDLLENWLSNMAAQGNHLVRVTGSGTHFHFVKGEAEKTAYAHDFQLKAAPSYYAIHKEAGWQLLFTSSFPFMKHSLWVKSYALDEETPRLTYDKTERKVQVRKVLSMNMLYIVYMATLLTFVLWTNVTVFQDYDRRLLDQTLVGLLIATTIVPIYIAVRTILYYRRMRDV